MATKKSKKQTRRTGLSEDKIQRVILGVLLIALIVASSLFVLQSRDDDSSKSVGEAESVLQNEAAPTTEGEQ